jgi:hypothetical protein
MLSNLKIFTIAILMRTVMHRRFNIIQYEALFLLVAGAHGLVPLAAAQQYLLFACVLSCEELRGYIISMRCSPRPVLSCTLPFSIHVWACAPQLLLHSAPRLLSVPAGITINQLQSCGNKGEQIPGGSLLPAVLCVLGSVTVPSAASVYNEKGLKKHMDTSVHLQNFFLYFYGMCFNLLGALGMCLYQHRSFGSIFEHQTRVTLILVVNNAMQVGVGRCCWRGRGCSCEFYLIVCRTSTGYMLWPYLLLVSNCSAHSRSFAESLQQCSSHMQVWLVNLWRLDYTYAHLFMHTAAAADLLLQGILSSFFYKFADTILKKYSSTIATIFTALMSWAMFGHRLTVNFLIGVSIVFVSMHQFFSFGDKSQGAPGARAPVRPTGMVYSPSMDHIRMSDENGVAVVAGEDEAKPLLLPR